MTAGSGALAALALAPLPAAGRSRERKIHILHTNDLLSHIEPLPDTAGRYAGMGGMKQLATLIRDFRARHPNTLLLDAGNYFGKTAYFEEYRGELEMRLMSSLGYDAAMIGSRELEEGVNTFMDAYRFAGFPFVCSNYEVKQSSLRFALAEFIVREVNGVRVGIFGLGIDPEGYLNKDEAERVDYRNPVLIARAMHRVLRHNRQCDVVVCLSHLGYRYEDNQVDDLFLANQVPGIDIIIGGHTRTLMERPRRVEHSDGSFTVINQVGYGGIALGNLEVTVGARKTIEGKRVANAAP